MTPEATASELRKTGISAIGDVRWGTHFCYFYETKQDLLDTLVLYFKTGLESKELCLWVVSQLLSVKEAKRALGRAVPDLDRHLAEGDLEIHGHDEWYLDQGRCDASRVLQAWGEKLNQALASGYAGLRASGDGGWNQNGDWMVFREYEKQVDAMIADQRSIILCTYPLTTTPGDQVFDVAHIHQVAVARRNGSWETIEIPELKEAKAKIKRLNEELEQKVEERTRELAATNEALRSEIAERKLAEEAVKRAEDRIRLVIDTIPTMAWSLRPDGVLDFLNQRWLDYTGLSLEEAIEKPTCTVHPDDLSRVMEKWLAVKATSEAYEDEMRLRRADGEHRWFLVRIAPLLDEQGSVAKRYGVAIDIEHRKRAEKALRKSEKLFAVFMDQLPGYAWIKDIEGRYVYVNKKESELGAYRAGAIGKTDAELWPAEIASVYRANDHQVITTGEPLQTVEPSLADGEQCYMLVSKFPIFDQDGSVVMVAGAGVDITDRIQAEEALRESENKFRQLLASNIIGVVFWSLQGEVLDANDLFLNTVGYTREDLRQGKLSWKKLTPPEYVHVDEKAIGELTSTGTCARFEKEYIRKDGSRVSVLIGSALLEPKKDVGSSFVMDITERKRVELALDERLRFETLLTELSAAFASLPTTKVDQEIDKWLQNLVEFLNLDRAIFDQVGEDGMTLSRTHSHTARGIDTQPLDVANNQAPWITEQLLQGNTVKWSRIPDDIPEQASQEREFARRIGAKSVLSIPVCIGGAVICAVSFTSMRNYRDWSDEMVARLRLVGEIFANAIARKRGEEALFQRQAKLNEAQRLASIGSWEWDILTDGLTYSDELRHIYGFEGEDRSSPNKAFSEAVHRDDRPHRNAAVDAALRGGPPYNVEFRIIRPDKSVRFVHSRGQLTCDEAGKPVRMIGMAQDITERKRAAKELEEANHQLRFLSHRLFHLQEEERRHLARELHDEVGQALTAAKINLQAAMKESDGAKSKRIDETAAILEKLLIQVRQISIDLRPSTLDDLGLVPALRSLLDQQGRRASVAVRFSTKDVPENLNPEIRTTCFRIAQEAITNAVRHANATRIDVELARENGNLRLQVRDNGRGFDVDSTQGQAAGLGLIGIKERAALVDARAKIISSPDNGTTVEVSLPLTFPPERESR
jgi:PAS domain S-box-containing protein